MEDKREEHTNINIADHGLHSASQGSEASFQLNRLLNFNTPQQVDGDQVELVPSKAQMLNFAASPQTGDVDSAMFLQNKKQRPMRDPMSHRIIEKRRRDRMNNCLADLSQLIPSPYLKQGQGRIEKTEIIEMAIKHIKQLQSRLHALGGDAPKTCCSEKFCAGYEECRENVMRYLIESLAFQPTESQNAYKHLTALLDKRKDSLPTNCTCKRYEPATVTASSDTAPAEPNPKTEPHSPSVCPQNTQQHAQYHGIQHMLQSKDAQQPPVWDKSSPLQRSVSSTDVVSKPNKAHANTLCRAAVPVEKSNDECHTNELDSVSQSPAYTETSVTPIVGDYLHDRQSQTLPSYEQDMYMQNDDSGIPSSLSTSTENCAEASCGGKQEPDSKVGTYKFKNDIKWRFTADSEKPKEFYVDTSRYDFKDPLPPHSSSTCSADYSSDFSGNNSNGNGSNRSNGSSGQNADCSSTSTGYSSNGNSSSSPSESSLNNTVPAFALHPMGVYYIPLVLPVSQVMPFMKNHRSMGICHPVSIPVSFTGPFHMGIPRVNNGLNAGLGSGYLGDKVHHRHGRHDKAGRRSHNTNHNRNLGSRRESKNFT